MPLLTRWSIRLAMVYLLTGLAGWIVYTVDQTQELSGNWSMLRPVSIHLITVGWLTQLIFAVIFWMFPIVSRENPYGEKWIAWLGFWSLNLGLIARAFFEIGMAHGFNEAGGWGLIGSALLQWGGASAWVIVSWQRIRERGGR